MKIGVAVPCYNREDYIGPYLEQWKGYDIAVTLSNVPWGFGKEEGGNEESLEHDKTEQIIREFFPKVELIQGQFINHRASFAPAVAALQHCDRIVVMDCDMFVSKDDWDWFIEWISQQPENRTNLEFKVNHEVSITEYVYDWRYGRDAWTGGIPPLVAVSRGVDVKSMTQSSAKWTDTLDNPDKQLHHFRFAKDNGSGKHRCVKPSSDDSQYREAPEDIVKLLKKWKRKLKQL